MKHVVVWVVRLLTASVVFCDVSLGVENEKDADVSLCSEDVFYCHCSKYTSDITHLLAVDISCSYTHLTAVTPDMVLPKFTHILDLSDNEILKITTNTSLKSATLLRLYLNDNSIDDIAISSFNGLPNLEELDLSNNEISSLSAGVFHGIYKLKVLNVASNQLQSLPQYTFQHLPVLTSLNIDNNNLGPFLMQSQDMFGPSGLSVNPELVSLYMSSVNISDLPPSFFWSAYNLRELSLAKNHIKIFPELPFTLNVLDLSSNNISHLKPVHLVNLPALRTLILNDLQNLKEIGNYTFHSSNNLEQLQIQNCKRLKHFSPFAFGASLANDPEKAYEFNLSELSFLGSGLETLDSGLLPIFSRLSLLDLRGNPWKCDCHIKWLLQLKIEEEMKEFISCFKPYRVSGRLLSSLNPDKDFQCRFRPTVTQYLTTVVLVFMCIALAALATWLVLLWPRNKVNPGIVPLSTYEPVIIQISSRD